MAKLEKVWWGSLVIAMFGIGGFGGFGFYGNNDASFGSFLVAGIAAWIALGAVGLQKLRTGSSNFY